MAELTEEGRQRAAEIAARHGVAPATVEQLLAALQRGGGTQAQFNLPELGGMGQWSRGGMLMIGDMFNNSLKAKVDALCNELSGLSGTPGLFRAAKADEGAVGGWPAGLGHASSTGAQNDMRYAVFPASRRLAVSRGGRVTVYDTGDHVIGGVAQAQSGGQTLAFSSQLGQVNLADLPVVEDPEPARDKPAQGRAEPAERASAPEAEKVAGRVADPGDPVALIERLAELHKRGVLSDDEFASKKAELLGRL